MPRQPSSLPSQSRPSPHTGYWGLHCPAMRRDLPPAFERLRDQSPSPVRGHPIRWTLKVLQLRGWPLLSKGGEGAQGCSSQIVARESPWLWQHNQEGQILRMNMARVLMPTCRTVVRATRRCTLENKSLSVVVADRIDIPEHQPRSARQDSP